MPGLGTIINVVLFSCGRSFGISGRPLHYTAHPRHAHESIGAVRPVYRLWAAPCKKMLIIDGKALATTGTTMLIVSFALGSLIGEAVNLEAAIENLGEWLKRKTGSEGDNEFTNAFCLDFTHRVYRCHGYRGINPRRPARRLVHARPQGRTGLHHRLHHDGVARTRLHFLRPCPSPCSGGRSRCLPARSPPS